MQDTEYMHEGFNRRSSAVYSTLVCLGQFALWRVYAQVGRCHYIGRREMTEKKPNVILVFGDQWRARALGYAGDPNVQTPLHRWAGG